MNPARRTFIGQAIGLLAGLPVITQAKIVTEELPEGFVKLRKKLDFAESKGLGAILVYDTNLGQFEIKEIQSAEFKDQKLIIKFGNLLPSRKVSLTGYHILTKDREELCFERTNFTLMPGDTFSLSYTMHA